MSVSIGRFLTATYALAELVTGSLGNAVSKFVRRAFPGASSDRADRDPTVFAIPIDAEPISSEDVNRALADFP